MLFLQRLLDLFRPRVPPTSGSRIVYELPKPFVHNKFYNQDERFACVDWANWNAVIDGYQKRFEKWYFCHLHGSHASYVDLCTLCALVDVFSYYDCEKDWHDQKIYKEFLRKLNPVFRKRLLSPITITRHKNNQWEAATLKDIADVFYSGVRCSLHHHGDLSSFAGMKATGELAQQTPSAGKSKCGIYSYPLVVFDPAILNSCLHKWFAEYCDDLRVKPHSQRAFRFREKFGNDFGVVVPAPAKGT